MARKIDPKIAERNAKMLEDYTANRRQTYDELAARYHVDKSTLYLVLRAGGAISNDNRKPRIKAAEQPSKGNVLVALGSALERAVHEKHLDRETHPDWSLSMAADTVGLKSVQYLGLVFRGQANITFDELSSIALFLGHSSVISLFAEIGENLCKYLGGKSANIGC